MMLNLRLLATAADKQLLLFANHGNIGTVPFSDFAQWRRRVASVMTQPYSVHARWV